MATSVAARNPTVVATAPVALDAWLLWLVGWLSGWMHACVVSGLLSPPSPLSSGSYMGGIQLPPLLVGVPSRGAPTSLPHIQTSPGNTATTPGSLRAPPLCDWLWQSFDAAAVPRDDASTTKFSWHAAFTVGLLIQRYNSATRGTPLVMRGCWTQDLCFVVKHHCCRCLCAVVRTTTTGL